MALPSSTCRLGWRERWSIPEHDVEKLEPLDMPQPEAVVEEHPRLDFLALAPVAQPVGDARRSLDRLAHAAGVADQAQRLQVGLRGGALPRDPPRPAYPRRPGAGLVFANLVDFDQAYGHRNDAGAANAMRRCSSACRGRARR